MSYDHTFDDYIKQLSLVRSSRYFPSVPSQLVVRPPPTPYECDYSFEVEYAARRAHEAYTRAKNEAAAAAPPLAPAPPPHRASPVEGRVSLPSTSHAVLQPVRGTPILQPSRPTDSGSSLPSVSSTSSLASSATGATTHVQQENFEDFEGGATIFDELHMKSIDDRSALNEIWGAVQVLPNSTVAYNVAANATPIAAPVPKPRSTPPTAAAATTPAPPPSTAVPTRPAPAAPTATAGNAAPSRPLAPKPQTNNNVNGTTTAPNGPPTATTKAVSPPTLNDSRAALAAKLTTKGFRSHVVQLALATLTHDQLPYVEYYIKATSNLEKVKLSADKGLAFLIQCKLTEKQDILRHAEVVSQLSGMGFPIEKCMDASKEAKGDKVKALDICLAS